MNKLEFDNHIKDKEELIKQLKSLKDEAFYMMRQPMKDKDIFIKDFYALKIVINYLKEIE